jgi:signal transduction histidine kinase
LLLPLLVSAYTLASRGRLVTAVMLPVAAASVNVVTNLVLPDGAPGGRMSLWAVREYGPVLLLLVALALGLRARNRGQVIGALDAQLTYAAAEQELREAAARSAERARIAAEMHDVLAHRLSLIALHTGALTAGGHSLSPPVRERIELLRTAATAALTDLRDVVGALREPGSASPTLQAVADLVADARASGQVVDFRVSGDADAVPTSHQLAVLRIVQEGLTNARKHAPESPVTVTVAYGDVVDVSITNAVRRDASPGASTPASGYGLIGLRERVGALKGTLTAGGKSDWTLTARLPLTASVGEP